MSRAIEDLEPVTREKCNTLLLLTHAQGINLIVVQTLRTWEEQAAIYAKGRTRPGPIVSNAKPGSSFHNFGRAFDVAFVGKKPGTVSWIGPWEKVGEIGKSLGLAWGGDWKKFVDRPHFEFSGGLTLAELREQRQAEIANA